MRHKAMRRFTFAGTWVVVLAAALLTLVVIATAGCGQGTTAATSGVDSTASPTSTSASTPTSASAPSTTATSSTTVETDPATEKTLVDMGGNTVVVPATVDRIAITCQGGAAQEIAVLGGAGKIVALPSQKRFTTLLKAYPDLAGLPEVGTFDNVNIEALMNVKPDVVIASRSAKRGNEAIRNAGIPVVEINTGANNKIAACEKEFKLIGELLGNPQRADELVGFWDQQLKAISDRLQGVPSDAARRVYYVLGALNHTNGGDLWGQAFITAAGGVNVAESLGTGRDVDLEQVIKWNPDVMILSSNEGSFVSISDVLGSNQLEGVKAVENEQVFLCPVGGFWWDRPSPEAILGITWLAKTLYPEHCGDVDLQGVTKEFFSSFYGYDLSTAEFEAFLAPTP